jgi:hypothetical protein
MLLRTLKAIALASQSLAKATRRDRDADPTRWRAEGSTVEER